MRLKDVLNGMNLLQTNCNMDTEITHVTIDSRRAHEGTLFCAVYGAESKVHGVKYAASAVKNGAACVLTDVAPEGDVPYVLVENAETALAVAAANLNGNPASRLRIIGVTGTNGKTTTTHLVRDILAHHGKKCGLIGTNELVIGDQIVEDHPAFTTTPEPPELHALFAQMADAGCEFAIMEVSSHALALNRVHGVRFEAAAYTNLSQDHLNYHETMEAYAAAKAKLFALADKAVINLDDSYAAQMCEAATGTVTTFSRKSIHADLSAKSIKLHADAVEFEALSVDAIQRMKLGIPGAFSVENALAAIGICLSVGLELSEIADGLAAAKGVLGRAEVVPTETDYTVMIDYAHSPDSLENILNTVRAITAGRVIVVFGCGGDRDRTKRPQMGRIAECLADHCIVTSDNPRTEKPDDIIADIVAGMKKNNHSCVENRREAIGTALDMARSGDFVLIAGKGQEMYQEIMGVKYAFDEREVIRTHLAAKEGSSL